MMARDRTPVPEDTVDLAEDRELVQVLLDARRLATESGEDETAWRELAGRTGRILEAAGLDPEEGLRAPVEPETATAPAALADPDTVDLAAASLAALLDRPDEDQLELANRAVRDLEAALR
jgi:hypothetical protein